jgi:hypothetical protein
VGDDGDGNRILNSDPVLWTFTDDVNGRRVLDAGCGIRVTVGERRRRGLGASVTIRNSGDASLHGNTGCAQGAAYLMPRSSVQHLGRGITWSNSVNILTVNLLFSTLIFWVAAKLYVLPKLGKLQPRTVLLPMPRLCPMRSGCASLPCLTGSDRRDGFPSIHQQAGA